MAQFSVMTAVCSGPTCSCFSRATSVQQVEHSDQRTGLIAFVSAFFFAGRTAAGGREFSLWRENGGKKKGKWK